MWEDHYTKGLKFLFHEPEGQIEYQIWRPVNDLKAEKKGFFGDEVAHSLFTLGSNDSLVLQDIFVHKNSKQYCGYENSHMGTNLFSDALTDLYFRQNIHYTSIKGRLAQTDAKTNWESSIPFYRDFQKYLNSTLPFELQFLLSHREDFVCIIPDWIDVDAIKEKFGNQDLYFRYDIIQKEIK